LLTLFIGAFNQVAGAREGSGSARSIDTNVQALASFGLFQSMHDERDAEVTTPRGVGDAKSVQEESFVRIGAIEQWITVKGSDSNNPIILFLHGGPGEALSPYADAMFAGWEKDFILVQWDQRGAGRTFGKSGPSIAPTLTLDRMTKDGIEVTEYLIRHLGKRKIILVGGSWGSMLGIYMAHARPDLFYAYVGSAQIRNWPENMSASYAHLLQMAEAAKDEKSVATLKQIGPFPWNTLLPQWGLFQQVKGLYQAKVTTAPDAPIQISPAYASAAEREQYSEADQTSFFQFWAGRQPKTKSDVIALPMAGPLMHVDLPALGTKFEIPIFIVQGAEDLHALPDVARAYFDSIRAPQKEFYLVAGTGHEPSVASLERIHAVLLEKIRPLAMSTVACTLSGICCM
jgi:pimeloyl-ACP methyl ester carboxylesterase